MNPRRIVTPTHGTTVLATAKRPLFTMPPIQPRILPSAPSPASICQCPTSRRLRVDRASLSLQPGISRPCCSVSQMPRYEHCQRSQSSSHKQSMGSSTIPKTIQYDILNG
uniref:Uncharacterized protein n=1 Tax=Panagrellus redivivus TaxID=6233 RepID=A0A7E4VBD4_PANRE